MSKLRINDLESLDTGNVISVDAVANGQTGLARRVIYVDTITDLQALPTSELVAGQAARIATTGRAGPFVWLTGDQSSNVASDPQAGIYVAPNSDATGVSGAWKRTYDEGFLNVLWFGAESDLDSTAAIQGALAFIAATSTFNKSSSLSFPKGAYRLTGTLNIDVSHGNLSLEADSNVTLDMQDAPAGTWAFVIDYATGATDNFVSFSIENITITDGLSAKNKNGIKANRCLKGVFKKMILSQLDTACDFNADSNLNHFDTCEWRANNKGWISTDGISNSNTYTNCLWRNHVSTAYDASNTNGNTHNAGSFEPGNASPVILTGNYENWENVRIERNETSKKWMVVGDGCDITCSFHSAGGEQAFPAVEFAGTQSLVTMTKGGATRAAEFLPASSNNKLKILEHSPLLTHVYILEEGEGNVVETNIGSRGGDKRVSAYDAVNLVDPDLTTWTASNCTVSVAGDGSYEIVADGTGTPTISTTVPGTFTEGFLSFYGRKSNNGGNLKPSLGAETTPVSMMPDLVYRPRYAAFVGNFSGDTLTLELIVNAAGSACRIRSLVFYDKGFAVE